MKKFLILILALMFASSVSAIGTTLPIEKSVGGLTEISVGDTVTFHLSLTATGGAIDNAVIWDSVPANMTFISAAPTAVITDGVWSWTDSFMNENDSINISIIAVLNFYPGTPFVNSATTDSDDTDQSVSTVSLDVITSPTSTQTWTPTSTPTDTPSMTETWTPTSTPTDTPTDTETITETATPTATKTITSTRTATQTITPNQTQTAAVLTRTQVAINQTQTAIALYATKTWTPTKTITSTRTITVSNTATKTSTETKTITSTRTPNITRTITPTVTRTPIQNSDIEDSDVFETKLDGASLIQIISSSRCRLLSMTIDSASCTVGDTITAYNGDNYDDVVAAKLKKVFSMLNCADAPKTVSYGLFGLGIYMSEGIVVSRTAATMDATVKWKYITK